MTKKTKNKEKQDLVQKEFVSYPDVAADIINVFLYGGEHRVKSENLFPAPTESIYEGLDGLHNQFEDVAKYEMKGKRIQAVYLIANQSRPDKKMLLRKAGYVGGIYREQYAGKLHSICPVIEVVLYWGKRKWRGAATLKMLFLECQEEQLHNIKNREEIGESKGFELWQYVDDMVLHVWQMNFLPEKTRILFQSDMRIVVDYLAEGIDYRSSQKVCHKAALIRMIRSLSGDKNVEDTERILEEMGIREEDEITMCELFDQYTRKGRVEGKEEGQAITLVKSVESLIGSLSVTLEKACDLLDASVEEYISAKRLLEK